MNILVVSESFLTRDSIGHLFTKICKATDIKVVQNCDKLDNQDLSKLDIIFIDVNKNNAELVEKLANIKSVFQKLKIIVLDVNKDRNLFLKFTKIGVNGYISNVSYEDELIYIIKKVMSGKKFYDSELIQYITNKPTNNKV